MKSEIKSSSITIPVRVVCITEGFNFKMIQYAYDVFEELLLLTHVAVVPWWHVVTRLNHSVINVNHIIEGALETDLRKHDLRWYRPKGFR